MTLEQGVKKLMIKNPFYGMILLGCNKHYSQAIETTAVYMKGLTINLIANQEFFEKLSDEEAVAVLEHEALHVCYKHILGTYNHISQENHEKANICMDCEINSYVDHLPKWVVTAQQFDLDPKKGTMYYWKNIPDDSFEPDMQMQGGGGSSGSQGQDSGSNNQNGKQQNGKSDKNQKGQDKGKIRKVSYRPMDSHDQWKEMDGKSEAEKELASNQIDTVVKNAAENLSEANRGLIPDGLKSYIDSLFVIKPPVYNWRAHLRRLVGTILDINIRKSRKKESLRFEGAPGIRKQLKKRILVGIDTSGSVSNEEITDFFSEINHVYKAGTEIDIAECDAALQKVMPYKGKFIRERYGNGGTELAPIWSYFNAHIKEYASLVVFTDGYLPVSHLKTKKPVIWVITANGDHDQEYPGYAVFIPKER